MFKNHIIITISSRNNIPIDKSTNSLIENNNSIQNENKKNSPINQIKNEFGENNNIENKINKIHPLDFYTLGKICDPPQYISNYKPNKGFRNASNDLLNRNVFSLNSSKYDNL